MASSTVFEDWILSLIVVKKAKKADVHLTDLTDAQQHFLPLSGDLPYRSSAWRGIKMGMILVESIFFYICKVSPEICLKYSWGNTWNLTFNKSVKIWMRSMCQLLTTCCTFKNIWDPPKTIVQWPPSAQRPHHVVHLNLPSGQFSPTFPSRPFNTSRAETQFVNLGSRLVREPLLSRHPVEPLLFPPRTFSDPSV